MNNKGYTLIEILVTTLILAILLSTVYASYTGTFRIIGGIRSDAEAYRMARSALDRMARDLQSAALWRGLFTFRTAPHRLGDREFVRLVFRSSAHIAMSDREIPDGISVIEYDIREGQEGYTLLRSDSLYRTPEKEADPSGGFVLCNRVEALTYLFYDESGKEYNAWDSGTQTVEMQKGRVPAAVLIRLDLTNEADPKRPLRFTTRVRLPFNRPEAP